MGRTSWREAAWRLGPPAVWMLVITGFSTSLFSAAQTGQFVVPILHGLFPGAGPETLALLHGAIRKTAHIVVFGILFLLLHRALGEKPGRGQAAVAVSALMLAVGFGSLDELHQWFVPGRTAAVVDVGWDGVGAALALAARCAIGRS